MQSAQTSKLKVGIVASSSVLDCLQDAMLKQSYGLSVRLQLNGMDKNVFKIIMSFFIYKIVIITLIMILLLNVQVWHGLKLD